MFNETGGRGIHEQTCKICGENFTAGAMDGREICLRCERVVIEKAEVDKKR